MQVMRPERKTSNKTGSVFADGNVLPTRDRSVCPETSAIALRQKSVERLRTQAVLNIKVLVGALMFGLTVGFLCFVVFSNPGTSSAHSSDIGTEMHAHNS